MSVPANIAEGYRRRSERDKARFISIAEGPADKLRYFLRLARDLGYGSTEGLRSQLDEVQRMLYAYRSAVMK